MPESLKGLEQRTIDWMEAFFDGREDPEWPRPS